MAGLKGRKKEDRQRRFERERRSLLRIKKKVLSGWGWSEAEYLEIAGRASLMGKPMLNIFQLLHHKIHDGNRHHIRDCTFCQGGLQAAARRALPALDEEEKREISAHLARKKVFTMKRRR